MVVKKKTVELGVNTFVSHYNSMLNKDILVRNNQRPKVDRNEATRPNMNSPSYPSKGQAKSFRIYVEHFEINYKPKIQHWKQVIDLCDSFAFPLVPVV